MSSGQQWSDRPWSGRPWSGRPSWSTAAAIPLCCAIVVFALTRAAAASSSGAYPQALSELRDFRGTIDYVARRDGYPVAQNVAGKLIVRNGSWTLQETTAGYTFRADAMSASIETRAQTVAIDDIFNSDVLINAWAAEVGAIATQSLASGLASGTWVSGDLRIFVDVAGARLIGFDQDGVRDDASYVLDDWTTSGPLQVPTHILRLRGGIPDASVTITSYRVTLGLPDRAPQREIDAAAVATPVVTRADVLLDPSAGRFAWGETAAAALACFLIGCVFAVGWTRRDAIVGAICRKLARDPRGWRRAGLSIFVAPDGALMFDGMKYRVGPHFYNRAALVQHSALFIRVSSPAVPHVVILPRKFRPIDLGIRPDSHRRPSLGFTLIETLVATTLFAAVFLLAICPALVAVARASALAAERSRAVVLASNALSDEEAVNDYDGGAPQGTVTTTSDGLTLVVAVSPGSMRGVSELDVSVADANGNVLAHIAGWLGVPVKSPPNSSGSPGG